MLNTSETKNEVRPPVSECWKSIGKYRLRQGTKSRSGPPHVFIILYHLEDVAFLEDESGSTNGLSVGICQYEIRFAVSNLNGAKSLMMKD
eukprot:12671439-Ditylum_brightwellii.AAC.1